jgi:prevent-host-death family protein
MDVGIKEAKNNLSKLIDALRHGEEVFLTKRGARVAKLVPAHEPLMADRGRGAWKDKVNLYPGWDSPEEDKRIEDMFEYLNEPDSV